MSETLTVEPPRRGRGRPRKHPVLSSTSTTSCKPESWKATDPGYFCNEETGRWNKVVAPKGPRGRPPQKKNTFPEDLETLLKNPVKNCKPTSLKAHDPAYYCDETTHRWKKIPPAPTQPKRPVGRPRQNPPPTVDVPKRPVGRPRKDRSADPYAFST